MPTGKSPKGAKGASFSPSERAKKEEETKEEKVVPIGRFEGEEEYKRRKRLAEEPGQVDEPGGQQDPSIKDEAEE